MVTYYLDTSAMLKLYVYEPGSAWLRIQANTATSFISSQLVIVESISAFNRRVREGAISFTECQRLQDILREDCSKTYQIVPVTSACVDLACQLLEHHPLSGYDAIHPATALIVDASLKNQTLSTLIFLSADGRLNQAAVTEGLIVDNPNNHLDP